MMKKILGLDLGTNSIGWALIEQDFENKQGKILGMGSRIVPMTQDVLDNFAAGKPTATQTAERTDYRSSRRIRERYLLRRERLHRILNVLDFLPKHYTCEIDFTKYFGQFKNEAEIKLAWKKNGKKVNGKDNFEFLFKKSFEEMLTDFKQNQPTLLNRKNIQGKNAKIPYDWTIYYLRKKALTKKISKEELAWLILNFNQKRGYYQLRSEEKEESPNKLVEFHSLKVIEVKPEIKYIFTLENGEKYARISDTPLFDWKGTNHDFIVTTYLENDGTVKKDKDGKEKRIYFLKDDMVFLKSQKSRSIKKKTKEKIEEQSIKIVDIKEDKQDEIWYSLILENGWVYRRQSKISLLDWKDKVREFIVTTEVERNEDGSIKSVKTNDEGKEIRSFRAPKEDDWTLLKKKTENDLECYIAEYEKKNGIKGTVGAYIFDALLKNPTRKIRGKLIRTIERKFYKDELKQILQKQIELQPELFTEEKYSDCVRELYRSNEVHQQQLNDKNDFVHLFLEDIIFYQRPLRSQKSSIGHCSMEFRLYKINKKDEKGNPIKNVFEKDENGKDIEIKEYLKVIPKSNPYYQEFRIWQWIKNLSIYQKEDDRNVTSDFLNSNEDFEKLFDFLNNRKEIEQKSLIEFLVGQKENKNRQPLPENAQKKAEKEFNKKVKSETEKYRWNYVEDKSYPCNETRAQILSRLYKVSNIPDNFLTREIEQQLWHIIYSVTDKIQFEKALKTFSRKHHLDENSFVECFKKFPPFPSEYGSYSEKAIKKLLPLMRTGKYWNANEITAEVINRTNAISERLKAVSEISQIENMADDDIPKQILKSFYGVTDLMQGLRIHQASYLVYGRHSEAANALKWNSVNDLICFLKGFKQHSLRNPIVEQIVTETLRVVQDIWEHPKYGNRQNNFFDEIHIELGREMKNPKDDRERMTKQITENENTNHRIKLLLAELKNDSNIENVKEYSPSQQEILKIYEDGVLSKFSEHELKNEKTDLKKDNKEITIYDISKTAQPTKAELTRYKLWLEQKYRSPYTGRAIPLSKLFTSAYQIEHIIPQSRYFDDSLSNKVICETAVNQLKDNQFGMEFIKNHHGQKVETGNGNETVEIISEEAYRNFVKEHYEKNRSKRNKLLLEEIPDKMIERQMNDTRYISKFISSVLSNIVREQGENEVNSKNLIPGNGKITTTLKQDWGLNDVWNELILPRFERMNKLTKTNSFTTKNKEGHTIPAIPLEHSKGFQKKRIDHRHHALDALVIACMTRDHVQYLNNENAKSQKFHLQRGLAKKLRRFEIVQKEIFEKNEKGVWQIKKDKEGKQITKEIEVPKEYFMPWENFTVDTKNELEKIVVSFKQNMRVINKATNYYEKFANGKKIKVEQKGMNWAIRKPMHEETVSGKIKLPWVKLGKDEFITATRERNDLVSIFKDIKSKEKAEDKIKKITDTGIQKILINFLESKDSNPELAFSPEGIEELNKNITMHNGGKFHQPIYKVRTYEKGKGRFVLGSTGNKNKKYVQGAPNLFFVVYERNDNKERMFETIPLNEVIEHQKLQAIEKVAKQDRTAIPIKRTLLEKDNEIEVNYLFHLSPGDLVYVPTQEERENINGINFGNLSIEQKKRIFNVNDFSGKTCYLTPNRIAKAIREKEIDMLFDEKKNKITGSFDTKTASFEGEQIKEVCIKLSVDRLGSIKPI